MPYPLTTAQFMARLGRMSHKALIAANIEEQARQIVDDSVVITGRVGGGTYHKSLRIESHVLHLEPVTRPADAEQRYVIESEG